jgi:nudix-type nucleoside diphosphatase (YffH/AdpP family)
VTSTFFYGTLCHEPLRSVVVRRTPTTRGAVLPGYRVVAAQGQPFPLLVEDPGGPGAEGILAVDLVDEDVARLDFFESGFGYHIREVELLVDGAGMTRAQVYFPQPGLWRPGEAWDFDGWLDRWAATAVAAARDFMSHYPDGAIDQLVRRSQQRLTRAAAEVRAGRLRAGTETLRRKASDGDVAVQALRHPYAEFFAVEERDLSYLRFDGRMSEVLNRAVFVSGDAAVVLPYDPVRDRVMLVEQFRAGPHARGDANPWLLETVAGRIDGGETPQEAARREAQEETRLTLGALHEGPRYYPSPAAKAEYIYSFVGIADLPDDVAGTAGLASESEDIRSHVVSFERMMDLVQSGEIDNAPLIILAYWLDRQRPRLRAEAGH